MVTKTSERFLIAAATILVMAAVAGASLLKSENPLAIDHDLPGYATMVVDAEPGVDFSHDPVFRGRSVLTWRASSGYMFVLALFSRIAGYDFTPAFVLLQLLLIAIYVPSMTRLLTACGVSVLTSLVVAIVSIFESWFVVTGTRWGLLTPPIPLVVCTALAPPILLVIRRLLLRDREPGVTAAILAGTVIAIPLVVINPATGMALIELVLLLALIAAFRRALSLRTVIVLAVTSALWLFVSHALIRSPSAAYSFDAAVQMVRYGQEQLMIFPFRAAVVRIPPMVVFHAAASAVLLVAYWLVPGRRRALLAALIAVQALSAGFFLRTGWLVLLPAADALDRIRRDRFASVDSWLWTALGCSIVIGPLQQLAVLTLWDQFRILALTPVVFEGARFFHFAYLPFYGLTARAMDAIQSSFAGAWVRPAVITFLAFVTYLNLDVLPFLPASVRTGPLLVAALSGLWLTRERWLPWFAGGGESDRLRVATTILFALGAAAATAAFLLRLDLVSMRVPLGVAACAALMLFAMAESRAGTKAFAASCAAAAFVGVPCLVLLLREPVRARSGVSHDTLAFALKLPREQRNRPMAASPCDARVLSDDFLAMSRFVRETLPPSALFHVMTFDPRFRAYARRGMLPLADEWTIPVYDGVPIERIRATSAALWQARNDFEESRRLAAEAGASYVVTCGPVGSGSAPLYARGAYAIHAVR